MESIDERKQQARKQRMRQKHSVCGGRASDIFNSSFATNIGSGHIVATTVRWTVVSDSPSSCAAKVCNIYASMILIVSHETLSL